MSKPITDGSTYADCLAAARKWADSKGFKPALADTVEELLYNLCWQIQERVLDRAPTNAPPSSIVAAHTHGD